MRLPRPARVMLAASFVAVALLTPTTTAASCFLPPPDAGNPWDGAQAVFVGTVIALGNNARTADVHVDEVWAGPDQPAEVVVRGGPEGDMATSVDRTYTIGMQYIFALAIVDGQLEDNSCSGTTPTADVDLDAVRPADVRTPGGATPTGGDADFSGLTGPLLVVALGLGALLAIVFVVGRREA